MISNKSRGKGQRVNLHADLRSVRENSMAGHLMGVRKVRAAKQKTSDTLRRGSVVGCEEVGGADDEEVVGSDMDWSVVVGWTRGLCGRGGRSHIGGVRGKWFV